MDISKFDYTLPNELIAHSPANPRDSSKLLIVNKNNKKIEHKIFSDVTQYLTSNDLLVFNTTKVFPARIFGTKSNGGEMEFLLMEKTGINKWSVMRRGKLAIGEKIQFDKIYASVSHIGDHFAELSFDCNEEDFWDAIGKIGHTPLPPYIKSKDTENEIRSKYQTVYANQSGSAAAPTAGLHFTNELLKEINKKGVEFANVVLHVGAGTFLPIRETDITKHKMHSEYFEIEKDQIEKILKAKKDGKRIIAVGTTTTRVLETLALNKFKELSGKTDIFIYPPYKFEVVDALITNFHLPKSTLLSLICAFVSYPNTKNEFLDFENSIIGKAYQSAIENKYRFYSFGDAMFVM